MFQKIDLQNFKNFYLKIIKNQRSQQNLFQVECIDQSSSDSRVDFERNSAADGVGGPPFVLRPDFVQKPIGLGSASKPEEIPQPPFMIPPTSTPLYSQHYGDSDKKCRIVHPASKGMG